MLILLYVLHVLIIYYYSFAQIHELLLFQFIYLPTLLLLSSHNTSSTFSHIIPNST